MTARAVERSASHSDDRLELLEARIAALEERLARLESPDRQDEE